MLDHPTGDGIDKILPILARDAWCIELLTTIAERSSCTRAELFCLRRPGDPPSTRTADEGLDRRLSLLRSARLIADSGELVTVTQLGAAAAAKLSNGPAQKFARSQTTSPSIVHPAEDGNERQWSSRSEVPPDQSPNPTRQSISAAELTSSDEAFLGRRLNPSDDVDEKLFSAEPSSAPQKLKLPFWNRATRGPRDAKDQQDDRPEIARRATATFVVLAALLVVLSWNYLGRSTSSSGAAYRFANVERANLAVSIIATGQIRAIDAVEVSSQLSGQVVELSANFNDEVVAGAPLARLDDKIFRAADAEAQAGLAHAKASHESTLAMTAGAKARYEEARQDFERKQTLATKGGVSAQEVDKAQANLLAAESEWNAARAHEAVQEAAIAMAEATLRKAEIDLERTIIRSPIDGVIIRRSVELGQTVAASMEAPTLFTIAQELSEMRVHARVDEADIGQIRVGQNVRFSVDAYPGRVFTGKVVEVHRAPETVQNVVTYTVVVTATNSDLALLPGMTALVSIVTTERPEALLVPNAALRFDPETTEGSRQEVATADVEGQRAHVWSRTDTGGLSLTEVGIGASDGSVTEVVSGALTEGQEVAVGIHLVQRERTLFGLRLGF